MKTLLAFLVLLPALASAQNPLVSLDARGDDVREVLATLFAQAGKAYALDASIKGKLYVKLDGMRYDKALAIVLAQTGLGAKEKDGVMMVKPLPAIAPVIASVPKPKPVVPVEKPLPKPLAPNALAQRVTTRASRAPLAEVLASLGAQAKVTIELDSKVPAYRIDAFFIKTSLRYALDRVCKAADLRYVIQGEKIVVSVKPLSR